MKTNYRMPLARSRPFVRFFGDNAVDAKVQRRGPFELRTTALSKDAGISDVASDPPKLLSNRLLILPVFIAIITVVVLFLGIGWAVQAGQLLLSRVRSLLSATA